MTHATIVPAETPNNPGFCVSVPTRSSSCTFIDVDWHFRTIDAARDFCLCCGFTWSIATPFGLKPPRGRA